MNSDRIPVRVTGGGKLNQGEKMWANEIFFNNRIVGPQKIMFRKDNKIPNCPGPDFDKEISGFQEGQATIRVNNSRGGKWANDNRYMR